MFIQITLSRPSDSRLLQLDTDVLQAMSQVRHVSYARPQQQQQQQQQQQHEAHIFSRLQLYQFVLFLVLFCSYCAFISLCAFPCYISGLRTIDLRWRGVVQLRPIYDLMT